MINIAEILKDCPKGTKLYSPAFGECTLNKVLKKDGIIQVDIDNGNSFDGYFNENGQLYSGIGECLLFPSKDNRNWKHFKYCPFKPFDKVVVRDEALWHIDFFETYLPDEAFPYLCMHVAWKHCLPYNEETAKLIGTKDNYAR